MVSDLKELSQQTLTETSKVIAKPSASNKAVEVTSMYLTNKNTKLSRSVCIMAHGNSVNNVLINNILVAPKSSVLLEKSELQSFLKGDNDRMYARAYGEQLPIGFNRFEPCVNKVEYLRPTSSVKIGDNIYTIGKKFHDPTRDMIGSSKSDTGLVINKKIYTPHYDGTNCYIKIYDTKTGLTSLSSAFNLGDKSFDVDYQLWDLMLSFDGTSIYGFYKTTGSVARMFKYSLAANTWTTLTNALDNTALNSFGSMLCKYNGNEYVVYATTDGKIAILKISTSTLMVKTDLGIGMDGGFGICPAYVCRDSLVTGSSGTQLYFYIYTGTTGGQYSYVSAVAWTFDYAWMTGSPGQYQVYYQNAGNYAKNWNVNRARKGNRIYPLNPLTCRTSPGSTATAIGYAIAYYNGAYISGRAQLPTSQGGFGISSVNFSLSDDVTFTAIDWGSDGYPDCYIGKSTTYNSELSLKTAYDQPFSRLNKFIKYTISTDTWSDTLLDPTIGVNPRSLITDGVDTIWMIPYGEKRLWKYKISTNTWTYTLKEASAVIEDAVYLNNKIYTKRSTDNKMIIYDVATDSWIENGNGDNCYAWVEPIHYNGYIYVKRSSDNSIMKYNVNTDGWELCSTSANYTRPVCDGKGRIYAIDNTNKVVIYNVSIDSWDTSNGVVYSNGSFGDNAVQIDDKTEILAFAGSTTQHMIMVKYLFPTYTPIDNDVVCTVYGAEDDI